MKNIIIFILLLYSIFSYSQTNEINYICITKTLISAKIRNIPNINGNEIFIIPKKKEIKILEYIGESFWKIKYENIIGYINEVYLIKTKEMIFIINKYNDEQIKITKKQQLTLFEAQEKEKKDHIEYLKNKYGSVNSIKIIKHLIWIGMTTSMTIESIGQPNTINKFIGIWGKQEQWVYNDDKYKYLYFENDILTAYQQQENF
jgi:hypothetical protein